MGRGIDSGRPREAIGACSEAGEERSIRVEGSRRPGSEEALVQGRFTIHHCDISRSDSFMGVLSLCCPQSASTASAGRG